MGRWLLHTGFLNCKKNRAPLQLNSWLANKLRAQQPAEKLRVAIEKPKKIWPKKWLNYTVQPWLSWDEECWLFSDLWCSEAWVGPVLLLLFPLSFFFPILLPTSAGTSSATLLCSIAFRKLSVKLWPPSSAASTALCVTGFSCPDAFSSSPLYSSLSSGST